MTLEFPSVPASLVDSVTRSQFEAFQNEIRSEINNLRSSLTLHETRLQATQEKQSGDIASLAAILTREQAERKSEIDALRGQFAGMADQLQSVGAGVSNLSTAIAELSGMMKSWRDVLDSQRSQHESLKGELIEVKHDVALALSGSSANTTQLETMRHALYGDPDKPDAPDSLFKVVAKLSGQMEASFGEQTRLILSALSISRDSANRLDKIEAWQVAQAERWSKRWQAITAFATKALTSKPVIAGLVTVLLALIAGILPQAAVTIDSLIAFLEKAMNP